MSESARQALLNLRDPANLQWYIIPLFAFVVYIYANEIERRNWDLVFAGLAYWGMDWFNEIWNSLFFHFSPYAPVWGTPGKSAFVIFIGLNIEICFMFAVAGIVFAKMLPKDKKLKILGIPNRLFFAIAGSIFTLFVEVLLNLAGMLTWEYSWWNIGAPWLIFLFGYFHFFLVSFWVFDMKKIKSRAITVGIIFGFDLLCILIFGFILKWI
ncbi:MAG: hypothetical protein KAT34_01655 [Candidatus Aminicenantes bacterium]|nr:hypothetical protein [Candidatus Aminicenantes bacterium]